MKRIIHLSDLHFGWNETKLVETLTQMVQEQKPHLTVVSGDFVEHAAKAEFEQAAEFVRLLPEPRLLVPGNHDLPFYNLALRPIVGLHYFRKYITADMSPFYMDDEIAVAGIDTARIWPIRNGSMSLVQEGEIERRLCKLPSDIVRVLVTHHPFDLPGEYKARYLVHHGERALKRLACCLDLLLAGHMHIGASGRVADRFQTPNGSLIFSQAGTAISKRYKGERNSFNCIEIERPEIRITKYTWDADESAYDAAPSGAATFRVDA
ncbi:MAG: metallophosphoesterase [Acidobacteriia bacterium]|nr:metallophosphoesterase [Terriglobia bacterium]